MASNVIEHELQPSIDHSEIKGHRRGSGDVKRKGIQRIVCLIAAAGKTFLLTMLDHCFALPTNLNNLFI
jgi:hypothetical protein